MYTSFCPSHLQRISPEAEMVIVRVASHPEAKNSKIDPPSLPAYNAVAKYLLNK